MDPGRGVYFTLLMQHVHTDTEWTGGVEKKKKKKKSPRMWQCSGVKLCFLRFNKSASVGRSVSQKKKKKNPTDSDLDSRQKEEERGLRAREEGRTHGAEMSLTMKTLRFF